MTVNSDSENTVLRLGILLHRVADLLRRCEDPIYSEYGITTEQYAVLVALKYAGGPSRVTDLAQWLEHTPNSVSMIVDRMVKVGLVKRARDRGDRRVVYVTATNKGENALKLATPPGLEFIREMLSPLSHEDRLTFVSLLQTVKYKTLEYLNPGMDIKEIRRNDITTRADLMERTIQYASPSTPRAKRQSGEKGKTKRKAI
jgi:DNA-binding MarR family transcriptional regulator